MMPFYYTDEMPSLQSLREGLSQPQRALLDEIWNGFLTQKEWPVAWEFHSPNRKAAVRDTLKSLNGSIVIEVSDSQQGSRYQLTLLGVILTSEGKYLTNLLVNYLEFLRKRYQSNAKNRQVASAEVQADLLLNDEETRLLGQLVLLGNLYSGSAGHSTNWASKDWSAGVFEKIEDFPSEGSLLPEIEEIALQRFNTKAPVLLEKQRYRTAAGPLDPQPSVTVSPENTDPKTVFVVHGRNAFLRRSMFDFLRAIGLKPLEWSQALNATGHATPYIGQVLDTAFSMAQAVVVLMTPDDEAYLRKEFQTDHDEQYEKQPTGQARPNVLFEAGMAMGRNPKRTALVQVGDVRPFSDVGGRHVLRMNNSVERRQELAERLRTAGCAVDLTGTDWHRAGSFALEVSKTKLSPRAKDVSKLPSVNPKKLMLTTKRENPQWADYRELNLGGNRLEVLACTIQTESRYFRFGFKLLSENGRLFGDGSIKSQDANLIVHVGRNNWSRRKVGVSDKDMFFTWDSNGISVDDDKRLFPTKRRLSASLKLSIDRSYVATFSVNGICCRRQPIPPGICRRIAILAWGDREEFAVKVTDLLLNSASDS